MPRLSTWIYRRLAVACMLAMPGAGAWAQDTPAGGPEATPPAVWTVKGLVREKGTRRPLSNVSVAVDEHPEWSTVTDDRGRFAITVNAPGDYTLGAVAIGYQRPEPVSFRVDEDYQPRFLRIYLLPALVLPDVVVYGERNPDRVGKTTISGRELEQVAGSGGDPLRGLQALPGIIVTNDASASPAIRGSAPGDNAYYVDFLPVGYLFHFGGFTSVINADLVDDFNLYAAAYGVEYGDVLGGVIDVDLREPRRDRLGGKLNINLYETDFLVEGPVGDNQSYFFGARRSYFDLLLPKSGDLNDEGTVEYRQFPVYEDYQGKYMWRNGSGDTVSLQLSGAADRAEIFISDEADVAQRDPDLAGESSLDTRYDAQGVVWSSKVSERTANRLALGHLRVDVEQIGGGVGTADAVIDDYYVREQYTRRLGERHRIMLGGGYTYSVATFNLDYKDPQCTEFDPLCDFTSAPRVVSADTVRRREWHAYAKDRWRLFDPVTFIVGARASHDDYLDESFTEPRLGAEWEIVKDTLITAGWGRYHQFPEATQVIDEFGNPDLSHRKAEHSVLGLERRLADGWSWKTEAYYKTFDDLVVADDVLRYTNSGSGRAYGLDVLIKKDLTARLSGWLALTHSTSERTNDNTGETFPASYDQPYIVKLVANYKLSDKWSVGAKWHYHSGSPYTPVIGAVLRPGSTDEYLPVYGDINSERLDPYHRLDLRVDRDFTFNTWKLNTYFELINAYNRRNLAGYSYNRDYSDRDPVYQLPLLPSFGVQAEF